MKITNLLNFKIDNKCIWSDNDQVYFYRFIPPNMAILTDKEKVIETRKFQAFLESNDMPVQIIALDKTENLEQNKAFFKSISETFAYYRNEIISEIESNEVEHSSSIQRAYYFVIKPKSAEKRRQFEAALENESISFSPVSKEEYISICRNYFLRDFQSEDLYLGGADNNGECI